MHISKALLQGVENSRVAKPRTPRHDHREEDSRVKSSQSS